MLGMKEVLNYDNFYLAFKRLQTVSFDYYKELYKSDLLNYGIDLERNIQQTILSIEQEVYSPSEVSKIYLPKINKLVRPITVLSFEDLLVYQAITNIIAESFYEDFEKYYNKCLFGNVYNKTNKKKNKIYFYVKWQEQWGNFLAQTQRFYRQGYVHLSEFDMASFYDTIDHKVLGDFLRNKLDEKLVCFLLWLLSKWTVDPDRLNKEISHGIPQGPSASGFLSEIYLSYIDNEFINKVDGSKIKYIRYADDIRLFAKDHSIAKRHLVYLDLLARDIGLIPQTGKIQTKEIEDIDELSEMVDEMSQTASQDETSGEIAELALKFKKNKKLSKDEIAGLLEKVFITLDEDEKPNKTIIRFALYRVGPNEQLKHKLIEHYEKLLFIFEDVCVYLSQHFIECNKVNEWIYSLLEDKYLVYHYPIALIFKHFKEIIVFNSNLFERFNKLDKTKHWYIKYFMLDWLKIKKPEFILALNHEIESNSRVKKKLLSIKYTLSKSKLEKLDLLRFMLSSEDVSIALQGLFIYINETSADALVGLFDKLILVNPFIYPLISSIENCDCSAKVLLSSIKVREEGIFSREYWTDTEYKRLAKMIILASGLNDLDAHLWINSTDRLNFYLLSKCLYIIDEVNPVEYNDEAFKEILNNKTLNEKFPLAIENFNIIHKEKRKLESNDETINFYNLGHYISREINALRNLSNYSKEYEDSMLSS